jgi:hypothetical protein
MKQRHILLSFLFHSTARIAADPYFPPAFDPMSHLNEQSFTEEPSETKRIILKADDQTNWLRSEDGHDRNGEGIS